MHDRFPVALEIPFNLLHMLQKGQFLYKESEIYVTVIQYTYELVRENLWILECGMYSERWKMNMSILVILVKFDSICFILVNVKTLQTVT